MCLVVASPAVAHPHVVGDAARVAVSDPEISKAYYGRLPGVPARYEIVSRRPFTLYAQITVPDIRGARRDYRLTILGPGGQLLAQLNTPTSHWKRFFEPFGGDHYLTGPEYRRHVPAGHYIVQVSRPGNRGTYVLAIGEAEQWGPIEALSALMALPTIKHDYFHQSVPQAWLTRTFPPWPSSSRSSCWRAGCCTGSSADWQDTAEQPPTEPSTPPAAMPVPNTRIGVAQARERQATDAHERPHRNPLVLGTRLAGSAA